MAGGKEADGKWEKTEEMHKYGAFFPCIYDRSLFIHQALEKLHTGFPVLFFVCLRPFLTPVLG